MTQPPCSAEASAQQPSGSLVEAQAVSDLVGHGGGRARGERGVVLRGQGGADAARAVVPAAAGSLQPRLPRRPSPGLTVLTPPEVWAPHMPSTGARPMVEPWKARALRAGGRAGGARVTRGGAKRAEWVEPG